MSEMGSIKAQIAKIVELIEIESRMWVDAKLPPPGHVFRLGENEFMTHVHVRALDSLLRDTLGNDVVELAIKTQFLETMRETRIEAVAARQSVLRQQIVNGIRPTEI